MSKTKGYGKVKITLLSLITFISIYFFFSSLFEIIANDSNPTKVKLLGISVTILIVLIALDILEIKDVIELKHIRR